MFKSVFRKSLVCLFLTVAVIIAAGAAAQAVPANPFPIEATQADGTQISIVRRGDEIFNWEEDADGSVIAFDEASQNWCYAQIEENQIVPGEQAVGEWYMVPCKKIKSYDLEPLIDEAADAAGQDDESPPDGVKQGTSGAISSDTNEIPNGAHTRNRQDLLVLLIEYSNRQFSTVYGSDATAYWSNKIFGASGKTVNTYYKEVSAPFDLQFTKPPFTVANGFTATNPVTGVSSIQIKDGVVKVRLNRNHPNTTTTGGQIRTDISTAFNAAKLYMNLSNYPKDYGYIMCENLNVTSVLAGFEGSGSSSTPRIWAHASYYRFVGDHERISVDPSNNLMSYATQGELYNTSNAMGIGVAVHELGHILGLPDLYSYINGEGIGGYSAMASGSWGKESSDAIQSMTPVHLDAWSKVFLGFKQPTTYTSSQYALVNMLNTTNSNYNIVKVTSTVDANQYFLVDNRQQLGFDKGLNNFTTGSGILIYHVDNRVYDAADAFGCNDNNSHKFVQVEKFPSTPFYVSGGILGASSTPNSNFHTAGHVTHPTTHTNCHPQNLASNIQIKVNSATGSSMQVELGKPPTTYTVTYNANGGTVSPASHTVNIGSSVTLPTPAKSYTITYNMTNGGTVTPANKSVACTVNGWFTAATGGTKRGNAGASYTPTGDETVFAQYTNPTAGTLPTPTLAGYTFKGWYNAATGGTQVTSSTTITANTTIYAQWTNTLTYNANGGSVSPASHTVDKGGSVTLPTPTKSFTITYNMTNGGTVTPANKSVACTVSGWFTAATGGTKRGNAGAAYTPVGNETVFAQYTNPTAGTLPTPTLAGYTFKGWYNAATGGTQVTSTTTITANTTIYAQWTNTLTYNANGGTVSPASHTVDKGGSVTLPTPTKSFTITYNMTNGGTVTPANKSVACTVTGWFTAATGGTKRGNAGASYTPVGNETVVAQYTNPTAGTLPTPTLAGYTFKGWYNAATGGTQVTSTTTITANTTIYAQWTSTLTYNANGGSVSPASHTVDKGGSVTLPTPTKSYTITYNMTNGGTVTPANKSVACTVSGWFTAATGGTKRGNAGAAYTPVGNETVFAQWTNPTAGTLPTPTLAGYTFKGWYNAATGGTEVTASTVITANTTIYAQWTAVTTTTITTTTTTTTQPTTTTTTTTTTTRPTTTTTTTTSTTTRLTTTTFNTTHPEYVVMRIDNLYAAVNGAKVRVNDAQEMTPIFNDDGRTMVPFRFIATCFGAEVDWDEGLGSAIIDYKGKHIQIPINMPYAYVDGVQTPINAPAQIMTFGRTFVPFRAVSELMGDIYLDYDPGTLTIIAARAPVETPYNVAYYVQLYNNITA